MKAFSIVTIALFSLLPVTAQPPAAGRGSNLVVAVVPPHPRPSSPTTKKPSTNQKSPS